MEFYLNFFQGKIYMKYFHCSVQLVLNTESETEQHVLLLM